MSAPPGGQKISHNLAQELHITSNSSNFNSTMVLTASQQVSFFEYSDQIRLSNRARTPSLVLEGIFTVDDIADWDENDWYQWKSNCRNTDKVQDPNNAANIIAQLLFKVSLKPLKRLKIASKLIRYYDSVYILLSAANIRWVVMKNFEIQRKSMVDKSKETKPDVPKLGKNTTVAKWNDFIKVHAAQVFVARKDTLEYLLRPNDVVVAPHPPLVMDHPYSADAGSIEGKHNICLSLKHPFYRDDNKSLFAILEVALRGTTYEASANTFQRTENGRGSYKALIYRHAGKYKWFKILRDANIYVN